MWQTEKSIEKIMSGMCSSIIPLKINIADGIIERARALKSDSDLPQSNQIMQ